MSAALGLAPAARRGEADAFKKEKRRHQLVSFGRGRQKTQEEFYLPKCKQDWAGISDRDRETWREVEAPPAAAAAAGKHGG